METSKLSGHLPGAAVIAAHQHSQERNFWLGQLAGFTGKTGFLPDFAGDGRANASTEVAFCLEGDTAAKIVELGRGSDARVHIILIAGLAVLLYKYTGKNDIILGTPIYRPDTTGEFINRVLTLRLRIQTENGFRALLSQVHQVIVQANQNRNYPLALIADHINPGGQDLADGSFALFDLALVLQNIQAGEYLADIPLNLVFSFNRRAASLEGSVHYDARRYKQETVERIISHFSRLLAGGLENMDGSIGNLHILSTDERQRLLFAFNDTDADVPRLKTLPALFEDQVEKTPAHIALTCEGESLTYGELNARANRLAAALRERNLGSETIAAIMMEPSLDLIVGILGVLKAGGAYLPISPTYPKDRILLMLSDSRAEILVSREESLKGFPYTAVQGLESGSTAPYLTPARAQVEDLDGLQIPDRSLVDYEKYRPFIGQAMVKNSITINMSRGCVYNCAFCFKIWPKKYVIRSAENVFKEIEFYYRLGVRRFAFVDDLPNIDTEVSRQVFRRIIDQGLKIHLHFPNGIRGDILTPDYIDLMVEAGTITMDLALETTSPRLQKLIRKNLNLKRLEENIRYITGKYPQVILELQILHGIPSETEAEARASLDFIKSIEWIHFPYIHVLNIYPNSDMARVAEENGISRQAIEASANLAYHELPETLPFPKNFSRRYQSEFLNDYFLSKERLLAVLPYQLKVLTEDELVQKYNSYLPMEITCFDDLLQLSGISRSEIGGEFLPADYGRVPDLDRRLKSLFPPKKPAPAALRVLLLDLSQYFSSDDRIMYDVVEPPLGLLYLLTHLYRTWGDQIDGRIAKSRIDFDSFSELKSLVEDFRPQVIGIRSLNFYRDFFHKTVSWLRQWGVDAPIVAGGPYATSSYASLLQDRNIDLAVLGEGEITFSELIGQMLTHNRELPGDDVLKTIPGIAFIEHKDRLSWHTPTRDILLLDRVMGSFTRYPVTNPVPVNRPADLAYIIYTSGSSGTPKGVMIDHRQVVNQITGLTGRFGLDESFRYLLLASITFDVSVMHIFCPLVSGARLFLVGDDVKKDSERLWAFIRENQIDILNIVPALMKVILGTITRKEIKLKYLFVGGESFDRELYHGLQETFEAAEIFNIYGPTETTINATLFSCRDLGPGRSIPVGKPLANYRVFILDRDMRVVPIGAVGELCISGEGVARGYLNNPELTAEKFITSPPNPLSKHGEGEVLPGSIFPSPYERRVGPVRGAAAIPGTGMLNRIAESPQFVKPQAKLSTVLAGSEGDWCVSPAPDVRLYKTGDLCRWLDDGNIEFLGRIDRQVKIRGFRIELHEIENRLLGHHDVEEAVVVTREDETGDRCLYAYVTGQVPTGAELREFLTRTLPDYLVPTYIVPLEKLPLNLDGKIDKSALPDPRTGGSGEYEPPRNELEHELVKIWADVLGKKTQDIGIDTNFFELGGHSLKAAILISRIHKALSVRVPLKELFRTPTVRHLAATIGSSAPERFVSLEPVEKKAYYPLSAAQKRIFVLQRLMRTGTHYHIPIIFTWPGKPGKARIKKAFQELTRRHESLRTSFSLLDIEPVQRVHEGVEFELEVFRTGGRSGRRGRSGQELIGSIIQEFVRPFDLDRPPLFRVALVEPAGENCLLLLDIHHLITDGLSNRILEKEFLSLYQGKEPAPVKLTYTDFSEWQNRRLISGALATQEAFWLDLFSSRPPELDLPLDFPRSPVESTDGAEINFQLSRESTRALDGLVKETGTTLFMVLLAAFQVLLATVSGQDDIVVGTPASGRNHADLENIVGLFVNTLALRTYPGREKTFREFLAQVKETCIKAFENQDYPFDRLVEKLGFQREGMKNPLFDVFLNFLDLDEAPPAHQGPGSDSTSRYTPAQFDITLRVSRGMDNLAVSFNYRTSLFKEETIRDLKDRFRHILDQVTANPAVSLKPGDLGLVPPARREKTESQVPEREESRDEKIPGSPPGQIEMIVAGIWQDILGRPNIGGQDNFFELGGDSIKFLQIETRLNQLGYEIDMRDFFRHPTIAQLVERLQKTDREIDQSPVSGPVPLSPIQRWFFSATPVDAHHYNQGLMLRSLGSLDEEAVRAIFSRIQAHHDALRLGFPRVNGTITQVNHGLDHPLSLAVYDFRGGEEVEKRLESAVTAIQSDINLETGPLMKLGLFHLPDGDRLLVAIHHLVVDGISWRILLEDLETLYRCWQEDKNLVGADLPAKTDSFRDWSEKLAAYADSREFLREKSFWQELESRSVPPLPTDFPVGSGSNREGKTLGFSLDQDRTELLLTRVNRAFGTEINDILLTAVGLGIGRTFGCRSVAIALEGHGREKILPDVDVGRTIGWFTSIYPVVLDFSPRSADDSPTSLPGQIADVKDRLHRLPNKGIGYGILRYLTAGENKPGLEFRLRPQVVFNYLGQVDGGEGAGQRNFQVAGESTGPTQSPDRPRDFDLAISGIISGKRLSISITYSREQYRPGTIDRLAQQFREELEHIILLCSDQEKRQITASDLTYKGLSNRELDSLFER